MPHKSRRETPLRFLPYPHPAWLPAPLAGCAAGVKFLLLHLPHFLPAALILVSSLRGQSPSGKPARTKIARSEEVREESILIGALSVRRQQRSHTHHSSCGVLTPRKKGRILADGGCLRNGRRPTVTT
jgi:hypothetical protein